jgi:hypothetical protein
MITRGAKISSGMWAIRECVEWKQPMFEITEDFIRSIEDPYDDVFQIDADSYVKIRNEYTAFQDKTYLLADTKDELKTNVIGKLFAMRESSEKKIYEIKDKINSIDCTINMVAGA